MKNLKQLIDDPNFFAYRFDLKHESVEFIETNKRAIDQATWLNRSITNEGTKSISVPITQLIEALNSMPAQIRKPVQFIFHTAYCGSTFLSRCLAVDGHSVSLREPQILLDAANAKRLGWQSSVSSLDYRHLPALAMMLLQKHADEHETLIIKPINSVNNIISELLQASPASKALMLYTDARKFLLSTLKKGEAAKQAQRSMFDLLRCDFPHLNQLSISDAIHMSDIKLCLTLWRLQLQQANHLLSHFAGVSRMKSLYSESLVLEPELAIGSANTFLSLGLSHAGLSEQLENGLAKRDAKNLDQAFSVEARELAYRELEEFYAQDLDNAYQWLLTNNPAIELTPKLSEPLIRY